MYVLNIQTHFKYRFYFIMICYIQKRVWQTRIGGKKEVATTKRKAQNKNRKTYSLESVGSN